MPTATEHRAEAGALEGVLDTIRAARSDLLHDRDDLGLRGGSIHLVHGAVGASTTGLEELGRLVTLLVDELHRRAALCDQFTTDLARYETIHRQWETAVHRYRTTADTDRPEPWPGPEPVPPAAPFAGAVAG